MNEEVESIEESIVSVIANSEVQSIGKNILELSLDSLLEDGLVKDVPFVGTVFSLAKLGFSFSDRVYCKKILCFLNGVEDANQSDRYEFLHELNDPKEQKKVGEKILLILDKYEEFKKATMLGKLYAQMIGGKIDEKQFLRMAIMIEELYLDDLEQLKQTMSSVTDFSVDLLSKKNLVRIGLMHERLNTGFVGGTPAISYEVTEYGNLINKVFKEV